MKKKVGLALAVMMAIGVVFSGTETDVSAGEKEFEGTSLRFLE